MAGPLGENLARVDGVVWSVVPERGALSYPVEESVVTEEPLEIRLVHRDRIEPVSVTMRTPTDDAALAAGFLFTEGILSDREEIEGIVSHRDRGDEVIDVRTRAAIAIDPSLRRLFVTGASCGVCGRSLVQGLYVRRGGPVRSDLTLGPERLLEMPERLRSSQALFDRSGGLHAAGLFGPDGGLRLAAEDVGRHNAVDKVIGRRFLEGGLPESGSVLQVSGRASYEIVQMAAAAGIPIVSAVSAPSSLAVSAADRLGVTLVAFVRSPRLNVYTHPERIRVAADRSEPT